MDNDDQIQQEQDRDHKRAEVELSKIIAFLIHRAEIEKDFFLVSTVKRARFLITLLGVNV